MATISLTSQSIAKSSVMPIIYRKPSAPAALVVPSAGLVGGIANTYCSAYGNKLNNHIKTLDEARAMLDGPMAMMRKTANTLSGQIPSDTDTINGEKNKLRTLIESQIPPIPDTNEIEDVLESCGLLQSGLLDGLLSLDELLDKFFNMQAGGLTDAIKDGLADMLNILEKGMAYLINMIGEMVKKLNLKALLDYIDGLLDCLDSMCGSDVSGQVDYINRTLDDLCIDGAGEFDVEKALKDIDIDPQFKDNVKSIDDSLIAKKNEAWTAIKDRGSSLKDAYNKFKKPPILENKYVKSLMS